MNRKKKKKFISINYNIINSFIQYFKTHIYTILIQFLRAKM